MRFTVIDTATGEERTVDVAKDEVLIGSDPECDIVLNGTGVLGRHVRHVGKGHHRYLEVCEGATVQAFGREVKPGEERRIDGREFTVGPYTLHAHFVL